MTSILGILLLGDAKLIEAETFGGTTAYTYTAVSANVTKTSSSATTYINWTSSNKKFTNNGSLFIRMDQEKDKDYLIILQTLHFLGMVQQVQLSI